MNDESLTINEFCRAEKLSRAMLYKLWSEGRGPRFYRIGNRPASRAKPGSNGDGRWKPIARRARDDLPRPTLRAQSNSPHSMA
jgi:hypothetical protein